ncbi:DUF6044 family protein [Paenibacillus sp. TRM 82003]|nr:DUF6044 family protein [Paenibacillus sp. TRM 82003]
MRTIRREKQALGLAAFLILLHVAPLFVLGEHAHIRVHDNLDSNIAWYRVLLRSGVWFGSFSDVVPQVIGGLPRNAYGTEFSGIVALHAMFPPMTAYALSQLATRGFAFAGMYLLLRDHLVRSEDSMPIRVGVALAFALTPFWPSGMLSTLGQPLALWAMLHIRARSGRWTHWLTLTLLPLYSSLVLGFFFFLAAMSGLWLWDAVRRKPGHLRLLGAIAYMSFLYLCVEYRLVLSLVFSDDPTSRNEFVSSKLPLWRSVRLVFKNFVLGHTHVQTLHGAIVLPVTLIAFYLCAGSERWRRAPSARLFLGLFGLSFLLSVWYAFWFYTGWQPLKERFSLLNTFNFARFHFLRPLVIYTGFALACHLFWTLGGKRGRRVAIAAIAAQCVLLGLSNEEIIYRKKPSFREFYAEHLFRQVDRYIDRPKDSYRVASVGLHPAIAQFNGFHTIDTYNNFYPLSYKHEFRKIIAAELGKNKKLRTYFDTWGGRCYVFVDELGKKYDYKKTSKKRIRKLELDAQAFRRLGGEYLFSAVPIDHPEKSGFRLLRTFEDDTAPWRIYLYAAEPPPRMAEPIGNKY